MIHKHHIIPRHVGGHEGPIALLTVQEHAEAHWILYFTHRRWQDKVAALALEGYFKKETIIKSKLFLAGKAQGLKNKVNGHINKIQKLGCIAGAKAVHLKNPSHSKLMTAKSLVNGSNIKGGEASAKICSKPIECSNGITYRSRRLAAKELNLNASGIWLNLIGRTKQCGGYTFKYI
jgi:hypothetical protein